MSKPKVIFTIGHSKHSMERFLELLGGHGRGIERVVDVRSRPYSRFFPHFNKSRLEASLAEAGYGYVFLGDALGGKPSDDRFYDEAGHVRYGELAQSAAFREGIDRLVAEAQEHTVVMLCAEESPSQCHRRLLITPVMAERGLTVEHIRGDGSVESEAALRQQEGETERNGSLFESDEREWKSPLPIRKRKK